MEGRRGLLISRSSWHYKIYYMDDQHVSAPQNLCQYFWKIGFNVSMLSLGAFCLLGIMGSMVASWILAAQGIIGQMEEYNNTFWGEISDVGLKMTAIAIVVGLVCLFAYLYCIIKNYRYSKRREMKEPGLVRAWLRAKKEKVCPPIRVVGGSE